MTVRKPTARECLLAFIGFCLIVGSYFAGSKGIQKFNSEREVSSRPSNYDNLNTIDALIQVGKLGEARRRLETIIQRHPTNSMALGKLGHLCLWEIGCIERGIAVLNLAVRINPTGQALSDLIAIYGMDGDYKSIRLLLEELTVRFPDSKELLQLKYWLAFPDPAEALQKLPVLQSAAKDGAPLVLNELASFYRSHGKRGEAVQIYQRMIQYWKYEIELLSQESLPVDYFRSHLNTVSIDLAETLHEGGRTSEAVAILEEVIQRDPPDDTAQALRDRWLGIPPPH